MSSSTSTRQRQSSGFVETARELGLDTEEAKEAFERAFGTIAPPKKKSDRTGKKPDETLNKKD